MKVLLASVSLLFLSLCVVHAQPQAATTIVVPRDTPHQAKVNGVLMQVPAVLHLLDDKAKATGTNAPIVIRVEENKDIAYALGIARIVAKRHDSVSIEIVSRDGTYLMPITKDSILLKTDSASSRFTPPTDPNPNRIGEEQFKKYQTRIKGELP